MTIIVCAKERAGNPRQCQRGRPLQLQVIELSDVY